MHKFYISNNGYEETPRWLRGCWIDVEEATEDDLGLLTGDYGIPQSFIEYASDIDERPRIDHEGDWTMVIIRIPVRSAEGHAPYRTVPLSILSSENVLATICLHRNAMVEDFIEHTRAREINITTPADFVLRMIYSSTFWFQKYIRDISSSVNEAEKELRRSVRNEDLLSLMAFHDCLVYFNTSLGGNGIVAEHLCKRYSGEIDSELLDDVKIEIDQAVMTVKINSDTLEGTMDAYASIISNNVNAIMKRMTAISIALMVPTLIASFYGMNVDVGLSGLSWAFWLIIGISAILTTIVVVLLKKWKWF